jgi:hypothetical protein
VLDHWDVWKRVNLSFLNSESFRIVSSVEPCSVVSQASPGLKINYLKPDKEWRILQLCVKETAQLMGTRSASCLVTSTSPGYRFPGTSTSFYPSASWGAFPLYKVDITAGSITRVSRSTTASSLMNVMTTSMPASSVSSTSTSLAAPTTSSSSSSSSVHQNNHRLPFLTLLRVLRVWEQACRDRARVPAARHRVLVLNLPLSRQYQCLILSWHSECCCCRCLQDDILDLGRTALCGWHLLDIVGQLSWHDCH